MGLLNKESHNATATDHTTMEKKPKKISFVELIVVLLFFGVGSWLLSFVFLGWVGNGAVTLWAKFKGIKLKSHGQDMLLHILSPLVSIIPGAPGAAGQITILYMAQKAEHALGVAQKK